MEPHKSQGQAHVLLIPFTGPGHTTPMLQLAQRLLRHAHMGAPTVTVTLLTTDDVYAALAPSYGTASPRMRFVTFQFRHGPQSESEPEPEPEPEPGDRPSLVNYCTALHAAVLERLPSLLMRNDSAAAAAAPPPPPLVSAVIYDCMLFPVKEVARRYGVPVLAFHPVSPWCVSAYYHIHLLLQRRLIPLPDDEEERDKWMEKALPFMPAMEWLRMKDLPSFMQVTSASMDLLRFVRSVTTLEGVDAIVVNTWHELDTALVADLRSPTKMGGRLLTVGPLAALSGGTVEAGLGSPDRRCLQWLDAQAERSVVYVSFGSSGMLSAAELEELAAGLTVTGKAVLWVARRAALPAGLCENERLMVVEWAPQSAVLGHVAVGAYVTHGGWNSTVEGLVAGVPMLFCAQFMADQPLNARAVAQGLAAAIVLHRGFSRDDVAAAVRGLVDPSDEHGVRIRNNIAAIRDSAFRAVAPGGSSHADLARLVNLISPPA